MSERLRIVVTGLVATYPLGGVAWDYLQYVVGLHRLGHEVLYLEDTGKWCFDPVAATFVEDGTTNASYLARVLRRFEPALADRWSFRDARGVVFGRSAAETARFCASADVLLHISASCMLRDEHRAADRLVFVDTDPLLTQAHVPAYLAGTADAEQRASVELLRAHDVHLTFGENVGAADCTVPTALFDWVPTRQPIVPGLLGDPVPLASRRQVLTTVASWSVTEGERVVDGRTYRGKGPEFERFLDLPTASAFPLELALSGDAPRERLAAHGWRLRDGLEVTDDPWRYRDHLARSAGEWSVAKHAYVASRSGWFSGRSACYLALGVPVVVQDTGFSEVLPTGDGVLAFDDRDGALAAIDELRSRPAHHAAAALEYAREHFDPARVLGALLAVASAAAPVPTPASPVSP